MGDRIRTKIQIERKGFIDIFQDISIPVTKSLSDFRDLSKRSGGYSTSIEVPATKNNINLFGHLYDLNITNGSFDIRRKYTCVVIKDDIQIFQGFIKMDSFNKYEGPDGETIITFNISLIDNISNFFGKIKDKFINSDENINNNNNIFGNNTGTNDYKNNIFWDDIIIPKYNYENIISTFDNTYQDNYKFFLPSQTKGYYETTDFKPAVYLYEYLNRIIEGVGYKWNGSKTINTIGNTQLIYFSNGFATYFIIIEGDYTEGIDAGDKINIVGSGTNDGTYTIYALGYGGTYTVFVTSPYPTLITDGVVCSWSVNKEGFVDPTNWNTLNKSINLDKLIIPYAGGKDVIKDLRNTGVYAGQNLYYYTESVGFSYDDSTKILLIPWAHGESVTNIGDIIKIPSLTDLYFQVSVKNGLVSGNWSYTVIPVDSNWAPTTTSSNSGVSNINLYRGLNYALCGNWSGPYAGNNSGTNYPNKFNSNEYPLWFNLEDNPYYDYANLYTVDYAHTAGGINFPTSKYIAPTSGTLKINIAQSLDLYVIANRKCYLWTNFPIVGKIGYAYVTIGYKIYKNGSFVAKYSDCLKIDGDGNANLNDCSNIYYYPSTQYPTDTNATILESGLNYLKTDLLVQSSMNIPVIKDDQIEVRMVINLHRNQENMPAHSCDFIDFNYPYENNVSLEFGIRPKFNSTINFDLTGFYSEDDINLRLKDFIPKKVKQSDFLIGLCKMFNLMIDYDESKKQLLILPRNEYYKLGKTYDWTHKLDISNKNNVLFIPDLTYKNYIYTYKADGDTYNKSYTDSTKETYGQIAITYDNDLLVGTTNIDNIFTSTPIARIGGTGIIIENGHNVTTTKTNGNLLSIIDYSSTVGLKCLYDSGLITDQKSEPFMFRIHSAETLPSGLTYVYTYNIAADTTNSLPLYHVGFVKYTNTDVTGKYYYPYIGHLDYPTSPGNDLNYALCDYYFFNDVPVITQNNLFYKHFERTIRQQSNGKLLKGRFHLTPDEINSIQFYDQIYVLDTYWNLNKITYNANNEDIYDIELVSVI